MNIMNGPMLDMIRLNEKNIESFDQYPFSVPIIKELRELSFSSNVTFFVGENGSGKSTLLEAIAMNAGFGAEGGSKNINFRSAREAHYTAAHTLSDALTLSWRMKPRDGYFFRAESFFNVASYIDYLELECGGNAYRAYGDKSLHAQSHGESFLSFFKSRVGSRNGFFIFDEPEAALSPQRQLSLLVILHEMCKTGAQFIIATHSPLLLAFPGATIYSCDAQSIMPVDYHDTESYRITKEFLNNPEGYFEHLF